MCLYYLHREPHVDEVPAKILNPLLFGSLDRGDPEVYPIHLRVDQRKGKTNPRRRQPSVPATPSAMEVMTGLSMPRLLKVGTAPRHQRGIMACRKARAWGRRVETRRRRVTRWCAPEEKPPHVQSSTGKEKPKLDIVRASVTFYSFLALLAVVVAEKICGMSLLAKLMEPLQIKSALTWTLPMLVLFGIIVSLTERVAAFQEIKRIMQSAIVPALSNVSFLGLGLVAASAGFGEEIFFRGLVQTKLHDVVLVFGAGEKLGNIFSVATTSALFGLLHAVTPTYFLWASVGGVLFGMEYIYTGSLTAASITHWLYDWVALVYIARAWKEKPDRVV